MCADERHIRLTNMALFAFIFVCASFFFFCFVLFCFFFCFFMFRKTQQVPQNNKNAPNRQLVGYESCVCVTEDATQNPAAETNNKFYL